MVDAERAVSPGDGIDPSFVGVTCAGMFGGSVAARTTAQSASGIEVGTETGDRPFVRSVQGSNPSGQQWALNDLPPDGAPAPPAGVEWFSSFEAAKWLSSMSCTQRETDFRDRAPKLKAAAERLSLM